MTWDSLPGEVWTGKIFSRLPVKSIIECRCVCKSWCCLITTPNFISTYHKESSQKKKIFVLRSHIAYAPPNFKEEAQAISGVSERSLVLFDNNNNNNEEKGEECLFRPMSVCLPSLSSRRVLVGSVNGLICFSQCLDKDRHIAYFILFNPSIGRFLHIPSPLADKKISNPFVRVCSEVKALGFDESSFDYKILYISETNCFIYSLNSNSWSKLITPLFLTLPGSCNSFPPSVVSVNGRIHWIHCLPPQQIQPLNKYWCFRFIVAFNLKDDTFRRISLPNCLTESRPQDSLGAINNFSIHEFGESFALIYQCQYQVDVWVMKQYGFKESWFKFTTLHYSKPSDVEKGFSQVLGFRNNDQLLMIPIGRYCIVSHNIHNQEEPKDLISSCQDAPSQAKVCFSLVHHYVPSLVLLDKENNFVDAHVDFVAPIQNHHQVDDEEEQRNEKKLKIE